MLFWTGIFEILDKTLVRRSYHCEQGLSPEVETGCPKLHNSLSYFSDESIVMNIFEEGIFIGTLLTTLYQRTCKGFSKSYCKK